MARPVLLRAARIGRGERDAALARLDALEADGRLVRTEADLWALPERMGLVAGTLQTTAAGSAIFRPDDRGRDQVWIPPDAVAGAMHGDRVLVRTERRRRGPGRPEGRVARVLARAVTELPGVYREGRTTGVLVPMEPRIQGPIVVRSKASRGARDGDLVVAHITRYPSPRHDAEAEVIRVLGDADQPRVQVEAVVAAHGLRTTFPPEVEQAARRLPEVVGEAEREGRVDLRDQPFVTIDGESARDFDDAILVEPAGGGFLCHVAIADVAYYVPAGGPIDREARARGTSVYFPDRAIPMLPEALSNHVCSLVPQADRLAKVATIRFDRSGVAEETRLSRAVIRSAARLTYGRVAAALADRQSAEARVFGDLLGPLHDAARLASRLTARRMARGALDLDLPETEVELDAGGAPVHIGRAERTPAHRLIEELMLAANEAVARELERRNLPVLYRVHESPAPDTMVELAEFLHGLGLPLQLRLRRGTAAGQSLQRIVEAVADRPEKRLVQTVVLRAMQQARYGPERLGHFGLALDSYAHFTSPIRRYPDLVVHRLVDVLLDGRGRVPRDLVAIGEESSKRERTALDAERAVVALATVQYMRSRVGERFAAHVSGTVPFGFFVELESLPVEGLVHAATLGDDFYEHDAARHELRGRRTKRRFRTGDPVEVQLVSASVERRELDFVVVAKAATRKRR